MRQAAVSSRSRGLGVARATAGKSALRTAVQSLEEKKVIDTASASYACDTTGSITALNLAAQGTDYTQRIGRKTTNVAVQLEGKISPQDNSIGATKCKVLIIYDAQPNGALPVMTDIFTASSSNAFMNLNNRDRFKIIMTENVTLGSVSDTATMSFAAGPNVANVSTWNRVNLDTIWTTTTGVIGAVGTGTLLLVTVGDQPANSGYNFTGAARVRFVDA